MFFRLHLLTAFRRASADPRMWTWAVVIFSIGVCAAITRLHYMQASTLHHSQRVIETVRTARLELAKGFVTVLMSGDPQSPYRKEEGLALLNQAVGTLNRSDLLVHPDETLKSDLKAIRSEFASKGAAFARELEAWNSADPTRRPNLEVDLRIHFHELENLAGRIDQASHLELETHDLLLQRRFLTTIAAAGFLLCGICLGIHIAGRNHKHAVESLHRSEERFRLIGENLPDGYIYQFHRNPDGTARFSYLSAGVRRVHGVSVEDGLRDASLLLRMIDPEQREAYEAAESESARNLTNFSFDLRYTRAAGGLQILHVSSHPKRQGNGGTSWYGMVTDITSQRHNEEMLEEQDQLLRRMSALAQIGAWEYDTLNHTCKVTDEIARIHDTEPASMTVLEDVLRDFKGPSREKIDNAIADATSSGTPYDLELEMITPAGRHKWVRAQGIPEMKDDKVVRIRGTAQDITVRKNAERALVEREHQLRLFIEHAPAAIAMLDENMRYLAVSKRWLTDYDLPEQSIIGMSHYEVFPEIPEPWKDSYARCLQGAVEKSDGDAFVRMDGTTDWVRWEIRPWTNDEDAIGGLIVLSEVITRQKNAEEEQIRLAKAMEQAAEAVVITDPDGIILYTNPAFEKTSGYTREETRGKTPRILKSGQHDKEFYQKIWDTISSGGTWHGRLVNRRKDGSRYEEDATISPVLDSKGRIVNYVGVKRDITREVQLEQQFHHAQKMEAVGQLAGGVAHDFNNILAVMIMQCELTSMLAQLPQEAHEGIQQIREAAERAASLTRQLLLFSRKEIIQPRQLDLNEVVTGVAKMLQRVIGENIQLQLHLHSTPLRIMADAGMMDQVLMNLAVNARDAMPNGGRLTIETAVTRDSGEMEPGGPPNSSGEHVVLCVRDTGCGISPDILPRIFEPFFTTKAAGKGTGLGLATVFGIIKQHHGSVLVQSEEGQGSVFRIHLPRLQQAAAKNHSHLDQPESPGGTETVLLVEDDLAMRKLSRMVLERNGYRVLECPDGPQAIAAFLKHRDEVDLLLTDLMMPAGLNGMQLARQLRLEHPPLKVVFMSGYSADIAGRDQQALAGEEMLQKPFSARELLDKLRQRLDRKA